MSAAPDLSAMKTAPEFVFFTDFDGTITMTDSNDFLTDNYGFGYELRRATNLKVLEGKLDFRDSFRDMMDSVKLPFPQCIDLLVQNIKLDPGFKTYLAWATEHNIPTVILSSGMEPIIRALLHKLVGEPAKSIQIVCNEAVARPGKRLDEEGGWRIEYHDESGFGHDKSRTIRPYAQLPADKRPTMFYAGDGVSDLSAAKETDLLFAKKGHDLIGFCVKEDIPFTVFEDWYQILEKLKPIVEGKTSVEEQARLGYEEYKTGEAGVKVNGA